MTGLTTNAANIGDIAYDALWYERPSKEQFVIQMIMQRAQKTFELKGMGVFVCSLQTFLMVNI